MIRVTVELVPGGIGEPEVLGTAIIANDLVDTLVTEGRRGSYHFEFRGRKGYELKGRSGRIRDFPRRSKTAWHLLARCLEAADF